MKLSVIIPVYNERATIEEILERVRAVELRVPVNGSVVVPGTTNGGTVNGAAVKTVNGKSEVHLDREIVLVDDGSTDGTPRHLGGVARCAGAGRK